MFGNEDSMTKKRKQLNKFITGISFLLMLSFFTAPEIHAEESAYFHVQTAEDMGDGTIRISVYLNGIKDLGGVEAELHYDPQKVSYVSSGIGNSFTDGIGVTNHVESDSMVKCVLAFTSSKDANGEMMYVVFKTNGVASYQPELVIKDVVDSSTEIVSIPYTIQYQQSDGTWSDTEDQTGKVAEEEVIKEAKAEFAAKTDQKAREDVEGQSTEAAKLENGEIAETENSENEQTNKKVASEAGKEKELKKDTKKQAKIQEKKSVEDQNEKKQSYGISIVIILCVAVCTAGIILWRRKKR